MKYVACEDNDPLRHPDFKSWDGKSVKQVQVERPDRYAIYEFLDALPEEERDELFDFNLPKIYFIDIETEIVGFNLGFDLPHLRLAYTRHNLKLPALLIPRAGNPVHDVMFLFTRYFSSKDTPFISLSSVATRLGLSEGKA